ncbi:heavy metal-responsive transcriptional regulator [Micromonospora aurantiaca (nom. illeg.)]|uniref:heavy metal-responsive transcriptional regulator n=1 Tax=Micromonospora aurantiaca (nom. illeg.) TaxID=47850 RepID=UPI0016573562|nr:heavy metal-responsive transcriptional regulator [Micromonospora aurantiaca]MBC9001729.1 heavy metal-responsive transcriptional regulator [Micromonospora aurantiaca]
MRIGELAEATGTTTKTLRFYEASGLLTPPTRTPAGYRDYGDEATPRLDFIRRGRAAGLTLAQIRDILTVRDTGHAPCGHVRQLLAQQLDAIDAQVADLHALRATVAQLHDAATNAKPDTCAPEQVCRYL